MRINARSTTAHSAMALCIAINLSAVAAPGAEGLDMNSPSPPNPQTASRTSVMPPDGVPYVADSGMNNGLGDSPHLVFEDVIQMPRVKWMRVYFEDWNLGTASVVELTSIADGGFQRLDGQSMVHWKGTSAYFNGDSVQLRLYVAPRDIGVFVRTAGSLGGGWQLQGQDNPLDGGDTRTLCGADDRIGSLDMRVCRVTRLSGGNLIPGCTGWLVSNGEVLTAGHCVDFDPDDTGPMLPDGQVETSVLDGIVEFNVPPSGCDGTTVLAAPQDQYAIDSVLGFRYDGEGQGSGKDWAVFSIYPNFANGDRAHFTRGFFRMTNTNPPVNQNVIRITGFGTDNTPTGCTNSFNAQNMTNQTSIGMYLGVSNPAGDDRFHRYQTDSEGGNSGSPILWEQENVTIGIHTSGGCTASEGNVGTSFDVNALENAISGANGSLIRHVNSGYPITVVPLQNRDGTIFRPDATVAAAAGAIPTTGHLLIVAGNYPENISINRAMTLRTTCGLVRIGN